MEEIRVKAEDFQERDSGWAISKVLHLEVNINKYQPLRGSSYLPLPKWVQGRQACINVKNVDDACFAWAIVSALYPADENVDRPSSYPHYKEILNLEGVSFPMSLCGIKRFEQLNNISVNVFEIIDESIAGPVYHTKKRRDRHINMLIIEDGDQKHFCWIKNISRLISAQLSKHRHKMWFCDGCLLPFSNEVKFKEHIKRDCSHVKTILPNDGENILKFKNFRYQLRAPVVVYADFEAMLKPIIPTCTPSQSSSYTVDYQSHEPYSFGYYIKCSYDESKSKYVTFRGEDCAKEFIKSLETELAPFASKIKTIIPMRSLTREQQVQFQSAINCHICGGVLGDDRVRDHCHLTGEFRGAAHSNCNLNYKICNEIPIVMHNFSGYDSHFIIKSLKKYDNVNVIPQNKEKFISLTLKSDVLELDLRFIDSFRFMASSLDTLVQNLPKNQFNIITSHFPHDKLDLLTRKGVFPYEYVRGWTQLEETSLPPQTAFYNSLASSPISDEDYQHAQNVWDAFKIGTLGEYSDHYLKTDVMLLAEVFENFRDVCLETYKLDPAHYYTAPGLSWDSMLKHTQIELELLTDMSKIKFISSGIRGGLSQCCGKFAVANNKYLKNYDSDKPSNYIVYLDANNLYGWAMSQYLPVGGFRWLSEEETINFDMTKLCPENEKGYFFEVDLEYPTSLHDLHNDLPFCFENKAPSIGTSKTNKLLATLEDKCNYVIHYINLLQAIRHGLKVKKIHRILEFTQRPWLKSYIDLNTDKRIQSRNKFEKDFYKLMNNAVFGKTMENVEKRQDVRVVSAWESQGRRLGARALIGRLNFHSSCIINDDVSIIQMTRNCIKYDKPIYVGFTVLELSKTHMFDFHYNYMLPKYSENIRLLYTDTDSFIYDINTNDFYEDIKPDVQDKFDTSDFQIDNIYALPRVNKNVLGKMKDEVSGRIISKFIGIRSKCYYVEKAAAEDVLMGKMGGKEKEGDNVIKKIKGIKKCVIAKTVSGEDYHNCIMNAPPQYRNMNVIRSKGHQLYSQTVNKIALKNYDDKRFPIPSKPHQTLALGHNEIDTYYRLFIDLC
ncbi:uncharacterized protein LOC134677958 [Cydia fagiglandana]|uniref:uncharacterized protein LOC134677958 n=1 Tax=Cydia fagiglandana TaxID=1458189 RepID=UPI002FEE05D3